MLPKRRCGSRLTGVIVWRCYRGGTSVSTCPRYLLRVTSMVRARPVRAKDGLYRDFEDALQRAGLTRAELARRADTQSAAVRRLLGKASGHNPTLLTVSRLAEVLGYEVRLVEVDAAGASLLRESPTARAIDDDLRRLSKKSFSTVLADPPWRFQNRTGKVAPEHRRLSRYDTMTVDQLCDLPVREVIAETAHLYLWVPNALIADGLRVMEAWGFTYKSNIVWAKRRKVGGPDGRGVGFYFRNVTELLLFGTKGKMRTLPPGRRQVNMIETQKREHSRKPDEQYEIIETCSPAPYLELFARYPRARWTSWGLEAQPGVQPRGKQYAAYRGVGPRERGAAQNLSLF